MTQPIISVLYSKIHRATVTDADLHYEGSLSLDESLMDQANLVPHQRIEIYNITNGNRFNTYVIIGEANTGMVQVNGAAAHLAKTGDLIIIASYADLPLDVAKTWEPTVVMVDRQNRPVAFLPTPLPV